MLKHKPYLAVKVPEGEVKVSSHAHALVGPEVRDSGWRCDGASVYPSKCFGGLNDFYQSTDRVEYRCASCGFDFCLECTQFQLYVDQLMKTSTQTWSGHFEQNGQKTSMEFSPLLVKDGIVQGHGNDAVGEFFVFGHHNNKKVKFTKQYTGKHSVAYEGKIHNGN